MFSDMLRRFELYVASLKKNLPAVSSKGLKEFTVVDVDFMKQDIL